MKSGAKGHERLQDRLPSAKVPGYEMDQRENCEKRPKGAPTPPESAQERGIIEDAKMWTKGPLKDPKRAPREEKAPSNKIEKAE